MLVSGMGKANDEMLIKSFQCPLRKFEININEDIIKICVECNFGDLSQNMRVLERVCKCPRDMTWQEYDKLREEYNQRTNKSRRDFWKFVEENYKH